MKKILVVLSCGMLFLTSCKKDFLNTAPASGTFTADQAREIASSSPASALKLQDASIKGIYAFMRQWNSLGSGNHDDFGQKAVDMGLDLMTEDMVQTSHHWMGFDYLLDNREETYRRPLFLWNFYYKIIFNVNNLIDQIPGTVTDAELKSIRGQALALRAYSYHYLVRMFQKKYKGNENALGVPVYTGPGFEGKPRNKVSEVYSQIVADLNEAVGLLQGWARPSKEQIDQKVAYSFLANVYLDMENWSEAESAANKARQGYTLMSAAQYQDGFADISNPEWMWGQVITSQTTTIYASFFSQMDNTSPGYAGALAIYKLIDKKLYDQIPTGDVRKLVFNDVAKTINTKLPAYAQLKFKDPGGFTGDYIFQRVAEMYLIEAEAQARQGKTAQAQQTLFDLISKRNPGYVKSTATGTALIDEIWLQKRIELWGEGRAYFDLKRLDKGIDRRNSNHRADAVLVVPAGDVKWTYKIPLREFESNPNMPKSEQNP